ncbi:bile acid:sodium symporter family protein [Nocardia sp. NBC_01327]|uniref:bile acid:sodium symporter family protein n=1 Tax=Nocardia sp. NBC_01327 TaxID=2903593 RepID=UPI002E0F08A6|nr:bile acid:sodium symporter [Nocardia sp. NBC_01327]
MKVLSKFHIDGFILGLLSMVVLGAVLPASGAAADVLGWVTKVAIALLFLLYGTRLSPAEAWAGLRHWRLHLTVLTVTFVIFPLLGFGLWLLGRGFLPSDLRTGVLFLCLVPSTVQSSIAFTSIARGNVAAAMVSASASNVLGVALTPLLVVLLMTTSGEVHIGAGAIIAILTQLLVPFLVGQLLRPLVGPWLARHQPIVKNVDRGSVLLVVYTAFSAGTVEGIWQAVPPWRIAEVAVICAVLLAAVLTITGGLGTLLGFALADRIVVTFAGSKKSLASGLPMAAVLFGGQSTALIVLPLMIFHQIQLIVCAFLAPRFARKAEVDTELSDSTVGQPISGDTRESHPVGASAAG